jgi:hypothetical protein
MNDSLVPTIAGLVAGIAFVVSFAVFIPSSALSSGNPNAVMNNTAGCTNYYQSDLKSLLTSDSSNRIELKERTWISIAKITSPSKIVTDKCTVISQEIIFKISVLL